MLNSGQLKCIITHKKKNVLGFHYLVKAAASGFLQTHKTTRNGGETKHALPLQQERSPCSGNG